MSSRLTGWTAAPDGGYESYGVEGEGSGYLANLRLTGRLSLPESEIIDPGSVGVELARDFSELRAASHVLVLDHRRGQWLNEPLASYLQGPTGPGGSWTCIMAGSCPAATVAWQLVYRGAWQRLTAMAHGWQERHQARAESQDWVTSRLRQTVGAPTAAGERRPFMRGAYRARAELIEVTPAAVSEPVLAGSGTATLKVMGTYRGTATQEYLLEVAERRRGGERHLPLVAERRPELAGQRLHQRRGRRPGAVGLRAWRSIGNRAPGPTWRPGTAGPLRPRRPFTITRFMGPRLPPLPRCISTRRRPGRG